MTAAEKMFEEINTTLRMSDIVRMLGEKENEHNKKAVELVACQVIPFSPIRRLHFDLINARAISIAEWVAEADEAIVGIADNAKPTTIVIPSDSKPILTEVYYRLFGGIEYGKVLARGLASIFSFYMMFWLLIKIGSSFSIATPTLTPLSATLRFAGLLSAGLVCAVAINALVREANMPGRNLFQQTMLLTAALLLVVETLILTISVLMT